MSKEVKYYGIHACLVLAEKRPEEIVRVYVDALTVRRFAPLLKWCAKVRKPYHVVSSSDLARLTESVHHEGVCVQAKPLSILSEEQFFSSLLNLKEKICLLYLEGVENPHNLGSILRTAAHFGVPYILGDRLPVLSPSSCRVAKGAAELVHFVAIQKPLDALSKLREKGFSLIATSSHKGKSLYRFSLPPRMIFAIGSESDGLSRTLLKASADSVKIPGTGVMDSLNVSVAAGLCIGEYCRQHSAK